VKMQGTGSNVTSDVSLRTRFMVWLKSIPLVTRSVMIVCVCLFAFEVLSFGYMPFVRMFCISSDTVLSSFQLYRVFLAQIQHIGLIHLVMNMISFLPMATTMERKIGSFQFCYAHLLFTLTNSILYLIISKVFSLNSCSAGLSGIIFSILVVDVSSSLEPTHPVLGLFSVPTAIYPWVLLVTMSILLPDVSFVGHLCGIISGYLYTFGILNFIIPSYEKIARIESSTWYSRIVTIECYVTGTSTGVSPVFDGNVSRERYATLFEKIKRFFGRVSNSTELPTTIHNANTQSRGGGHVLGSEMSANIPQIPLSDVSPSSPTVN